MKRMTVLVSVVLSVAALAKDPAYPTSGLLHHTTEASSVQYSCSLVGQELQCDMTQGFVRKKLNDVDIPKRSSDLLASIIKSGIDKEQCKIVDNSGKLFRERVADPSKVPPEYRREFEQMSQIQKDSVINYLKLTGDVCKTNSFASKQALRDYLLKVEAGTCRVGTNHWKETFQRQPNSTGSVWVSTGEPQGVCRVVQLNRFELDKDEGSQFWNYVARKAVTNPSGELPFAGKCSGLDEGTYEYSWKSRDLFLNCTKIDFSVF